jgi:hypothetical protein
VELAEQNILSANSANSALREPQGIPSPSRNAFKFVRERQDPT